VSDRITVITTCTNRKVAPSDSGEFDELPGLQREATTFPAERLYAGGQHRRLMDGVDSLRAHRPVDVWVISAKAGLVPGNVALLPYDESFTGLTPDEVRHRADVLQIPLQFRTIAAKPSALTIVLAGNDYFDAALLAEPIDWRAPAIAFVSPSRATKLVVHPLLRTVPVGQSVAKAWSLPLTLLKGELVRRMLQSLTEGFDPAALLSHQDHLDRLLAPDLQPAIGQ
jgi:hypothetical protein